MEYALSESVKTFVRQLTALANGGYEIVKKSDLDTGETVYRVRVVER